MAVQRVGRVNSGWRVDSGLLARIDEACGARGMNRSRWMEEAALAHLERDPRVARDLARALEVVLSTDSEAFRARAAEVLVEYERVTRV